MADDEKKPDFSHATPDLLEAAIKEDIRSEGKAMTPLERAEAIRELQRKAGTDKTR